MKNLDDKELDGYISDSIQYVNSSECKDHADYFYTNGKVDRIDIIGMGVLGQNITKADIKTQYYEAWTGGRTGEKLRMNLKLSVKIIAKIVEYYLNITLIFNENILNQIIKKIILLFTNKSIISDFIYTYKDIYTRQL